MTRDSRSGRLTRRELLAAASAAFITRPAAIAGQQRTGTIPVRGLNHVHLIVSDLKRSLEFYQTLFGMRLQAHQGVEADWSRPVIPLLSIGNGPHFISFSEGSPGPKGRIDHFGFGMDRFDAGKVTRMLGDHGLKATVRMRADSMPPVAELTFNDPDNIVVQIQDTSYCGGSGPLGNRCKPQPPPNSGPIPLPVSTLNHFTLTVSDVQRSVDFYQQVFGMRMQFMQATEADWKKPVVPVLGIEKGPQFLAFSRGGAAGVGRIDHFCLGMPDFQSARVVKILADRGIKANVRMRADSEPPAEELMFADPDGIRVQIQDASYCGGGGILGNRCDSRQVRRSD
jgi:catechol 2,3-dioxygenase-like lactoylglutathione lyase family enzyme